MTVRPDPATGAEPTAEPQLVAPTDTHELKQRRLLFAIVLMLLALVLLFVTGGNVVPTVVVAIFGLIVGVSGL